MIQNEPDGDHATAAGLRVALAGTRRYQRMHCVLLKGCIIYDIPRGELGRVTCTATLVLERVCTCRPVYMSSYSILHTFCTASQVEENGPPGGVAVALTVPWERELKKDKIKHRSEGASPDAAAGAAASEVVSRPRRRPSEKSLYGFPRGSWRCHPAQLAFARPAPRSGPPRHGAR